jgi:diguanylate cyclase (GGDEF)-like protein
MSHSLAKFHFHSFANLLLNLLILGVVGYLLITDLRVATNQEQAAETAQRLASDVRGLLSNQRTAVEKLAKRPEVTITLRQGNIRDQQREAEELRKLLPQSKTAWLLPANSVSERKFPPLLDEACRDLVLRAAAGMANVPIEYHAAHTPDEHYDVLQPVLDENKRPLGFLLLSFESAPLQSIVERQVSTSAYMELHQLPIGEISEVAFNYGNRAETESAPAISVTLDPLPWTLKYWSANVHPAILAEGRQYYFLIMVVAALSLIVMSYSLYRSTVNSIQHDLKSLANMIRDVRSGTVRKDYPMELEEFASALLYLKDSGKKLIEEKQKLREMGLLDHLSQLSNRRHFELSLKEAFETQKINGPSSLLILDIDRFKLVNDRFGHAAGDELIVKFANVLRRCVRQTDVLARLGGDEFCIIYTFTPLQKARVLSERLRKQLPREVRLSHGIVHSLRWSGGLSVMCGTDKIPDDVLVRADQALLRAKESGRNTTLLEYSALSPAQPSRAVVS